MKPIKDRLIVQQDAPPIRSAGNIELTPATAAQLMRPVGTVLEIGPDVTNVQEGDRVLFDIAVSVCLPADDFDRFFVTTEDDVIVILEEGDPNFVPLDPEIQDGPPRIVVPEPVCQIGEPS